MSTSSRIRRGGRSSLSGSCASSHSASSGTHLRHFAASTWLRLGTPVHEVAEYLGDDPRTVLAVYAHVLGEGQRRDHAQRLQQSALRT